MSIWKLTSGAKESTEPQETVNSKGEQKDNKVTQTTEENEKKIKLDGPLSAIYTQALNVLYSKEDMAGMILPSDDQEVVDDSDLYVYCTQADLVDNNLTEIADKITEASKHDVNVVAIECNSMIPGKMKLLEDLGRSLGVELYVTRKSALEAIKTKLRK